MECFQVCLVHPSVQGACSRALPSLPSTHPARSMTDLWSRLSLLDYSRPESTIAILDGSRMLIPKAEQRALLEKLHLDHAGSARTKQKANQKYFWRTMARDIEVLCNSCEACAITAKSKPLEPPLMPSLSQGGTPMEQVSVDLFEFEKETYLIAVCNYSSYCYVKNLKKSQTFKAVKKA